MRSDHGDWRCAWRGGSLSCCFPGSISADARGKGPWFCRFHFFAKDGEESVNYARQSQGYRAGDTVPVRELGEGSPSPFEGWGKHFRELP